MKSFKLAILYGLILWAIPFFVAVIVFPLKQSQDPFFETIMAVTLAICVVIFSTLYLRKLDAGFLSEGIKLGIIWFLMSVLIDLLLFMWGPMKMTFWAYMRDIGFTYLMYPTVSAGFGYVLEKKTHLTL